MYMYVYLYNITIYVYIIQYCYQVYATSLLTKKCLQLFGCCTLQLLYRQFVFFRPSQ